jgi:PAS domain S-box-containing protein
MAHAIVLVLDPQGRIVHFNAHMEEISGYRLSEVEGSNWFDTFLPAADHPRVRGVFARAMSEGEIHGNINPIVTKQGAMRQIEWYAKTLNSHDGEMIGVISVGHDITERLADQAKVRELEHESRQRGRLADIGAITAKVVHDLGNPLAAVSMQAQLILRRAKRGDFQPAEAVEKPVAQILSTLRRLETLVREFTDFAREQRLQLSDVRLPDLLGGIIELWRDYASGRGVEIHAELIDEPAEIRADEEMLRRVLDNIVKNALDAVESMERSSGTIVIRTSQSTQDRVTISVADDGPGIPHDFDAFRLFETSKPSGTGIGLAVAQQIVFAHNGTIDFASNSPQGTVFRIHLPIAGPGENEIDTSPV